MFLTHIKAGADDRSPYGEFWFKPVNHGGVGGPVTIDRAMQLPVVLACVRVLAESFSVLPLKIYKRDGTKRTLVTKHWLYDLIGRHPNPFQTAFEWREMMQGHLALRGNAYNQIISDRRGNITAFMPMHPDRVQIEFIQGGTDFDYRYRYTDRSGVVTTFTRNEVWHIRGLSSDGVQGMNPIALMRESVGLGLAAQEYGSRFFQNDAKPGGGWIEFPGNFKDKATRDTFRESFQAAQTGINRGKMAVLEFGMKFHELGMSNVDSQFLEARQYQVGDIARMFRVPPHLVGDLSKATFSNIEQQSLDFVIHTMTPWSERWETSIEGNLLLENEQDLDVEFDFTALLRGDQAARGTFYHNGIIDGWMTRNEARAHESLEPIDGLDEPLRPLNMVEESQAPDEKAEPPDTTNGTADDLSENAPVNDDGTAARMATLLSGNAERMARRMAAGKPPTADALAGALAVSADTARTWLESPHEDVTESQYKEQLMALGANA